MDARLKAFPPAFVKQIQESFPPGQVHAVLASYLEPRQTSLRINTIKALPEEVLSVLQQQGFCFEVDRQIPNCVHLKKFSDKKLRELQIYAEGKIYLQNFSSQVPPLILKPEPGERVLDLCASPGSKTTQMSALMKNQGEIVALEPDPVRFERLKHNLALLGCQNVLPLKTRAESFCRHFFKKMVAGTERPFDKILIDAPCSGGGTFYINHRPGFAHWSLCFIEEISRLQKKLLELACAVVKPGGLILYSTCSVGIEENERVIENFLTQNKNFSLIKPTLFSFLKPSFSKQTLFSQRIYPSKLCEGFFVALFKKENLST